MLGFINVEPGDRETRVTNLLEAIQVIIESKQPSQRPETPLQKAWRELGFPQEGYNEDLSSQVLLIRQALAAALHKMGRGDQIESLGILDLTKTLTDKMLKEHPLRGAVRILTRELDYTNDSYMIGALKEGKSNIRSVSKRVREHILGPQKS